MTGLTLAVFVACVALDALGLILDLWLHSQGHRTISERVWQAPVLGLPLLAVQGVALAALAWHLYGRR